MIQNYFSLTWKINFLSVIKEPLEHIENRLSKLFIAPMDYFLSENASLSLLTNGMFAI